MNHPVDKIELIIMGGTFLEYSYEFQNSFIKGCYDALNNKKSKNLEDAKKLNESSKTRCVALCVETRPDKAGQFIKRMRKWGVTRVELGVQVLDDEIYTLVNRGHNIQDVVDATRDLKNAGFKIGYHLMPGLPGSSFKKDIQKFKKIFSDSRFRPDQLKIYPCQVMPGSVLEDWYWKKKYKPYSEEEIRKLLFEMFKQVPRYCRVMRVMREIPPEYIIAGTKRIDLRAEVEKEIRDKKIIIKEIRFREIGFAKKLDDADKNLKLKITSYKASGGKEYFLEIVNKNDILFGLLRLRIVNGDAFVRELHVYGPALKLGEEYKKKSASQHKGFGKWLLEEAEKIAKKEKCSSLKIISGVGVRGYYKKLGYFFDRRGYGEYMIKIF